MGELERFFHPLLLDVGFGELGPFQRHGRVGSQCRQQRLVPFIKDSAAFLIQNLDNAD